MDPQQKKKLVARFVEIRANAKAEKRTESPEEQKELSAIQESLGLTAEEIYAAFAETYPA
jgi:hypothetical protein